jgi:phage baseplate assembly protein W
MDDVDGLFRSRSRSFTDLSVSFIRNPITDDLVHVKDESSVTQSIKNLILTKFGEKLMNPSVGSDVYNMLFEPLDAFSGMALRDKILNTITNFEPRIEVLDLIVSALEDTDDLISVSLTYRIVGEPKIIQSQFILERPSS